MILAAGGFVIRDTIVEGPAEKKEEGLQSPFSAGLHHRGGAVVRHPCPTTEFEGRKMQNMSHKRSCGTQAAGAPHRHGPAGDLHLLRGCHRPRDHDVPADAGVRGGGFFQPDVRCCTSQTPIGRRRSVPLLVITYSEKIQGGDRV